jgi:hypothetical protein
MPPGERFALSRPRSKPGNQEAAPAVSNEAAQACGQGYGRLGLLTTVEIGKSASPSVLAWVASANIILPGTRRCRHGTRWRIPSPQCRPSEVTAATHLIWEGRLSSSPTYFPRGLLSARLNQFQSELRRNSIQVTQRAVKFPDFTIRLNAGSHPTGIFCSPVDTGADFVPIRSTARRSQGFALVRRSPFTA